MALKKKTHDRDKVSATPRAPRQTARPASGHEHLLSPALALQRAASVPPFALRPADILSLQRTVGNRAVRHLLGNQPAAPPAQSSASANAVQRKTEEEEPRRGRFGTGEMKENRTGLPDSLKSGIENLSGMSMDDVRVHYNSSAPAEVQALAYTQGADIHVGPGQEEHLPHEAWHVVQQKQGRVKPTLQLKGAAINDDARLEEEADAMGRRLSHATPLHKKESGAPVKFKMADGSTIQRIPALAAHLVGAYASNFDSKHVRAVVAADTAAKVGDAEKRTVPFNTVLQEDYIWGEVAAQVTGATKAAEYKYEGTAKAAGANISIAELKKGRKKDYYKPLSAVEVQLYSFSVNYRVADDGAKKKVTLYHLECP